MGERIASVPASSMTQKEEEVQNQFRLLDVEGVGMAEVAEGGACAPATSFRQ